MSTDRATRIKQIFLEAVEAVGETRSRLIEERCAGDASLRADVERLLLADTDLPTRFLDGSPPALMDAPMPGRIGPFRIIRRIGTGGMGAVFEAEQDHPRRRVALKVIRDAMLSDALRRRFDYEVQVLGQLRHPGIAQIYEAGTRDDGSGAVPYFAMEYIEGEPLLDFARTHELCVRQKLSLAAEIADAVHHAHQKGVIHRDLKPANILVEEPSAGAPRPKVLDFGVARALHADPLSASPHTMPGQLIGTLNYMSPEQITGRAEDTDIRSDVYALGATLYELLAGRPPHHLDAVTLPAASRAICHAEPARLGTVDPRLRGDVETIVAKALEKDRERRYPSAAALSEDIRRFLRDEPIEARPPSRAYLLRKFAVRNKALVAGTVAVFVTLMLGLTGTGAALLQARRAQLQAEANAVEARKSAGRALAVRNFLAELISWTDPATSLKRDPTLRDALDAAASRIESGDLRNQPDAKAELHTAIGDAYDALGHYPEAERHLRAALHLQRELLGHRHPVIARVLVELALALNGQGRHEEEEQLLREALDIFRANHGEGHADVATATQSLAACLRSQSRYDEAEPLYREALATRRKLLGDRHIDVAQSLNSLALLHQNRGELAEAEPLFREALVIRRELLGNPHPLVADSLSNLSMLLQLRGELVEAETDLREALAMRRLLLDADHPRLAESLNNLAFVLYQKGDLDAAVPLYEEALAIWRKSLPEGHPNIGNGLAGLGMVQLSKDDYLKAESLLREAWAIRMARTPPGHWSRFTVQSALGGALTGQGRFAEAEGLLVSAYEGLHAAPGTPPARVKEAAQRLVELYEAWAKPELAEVWKEKSPP